VSSAAELFGSSIDTGLLAALKTAAQQGEAEKVENISSQVRDHVDQIQEVSDILIYFNVSISHGRRKICLSW